MDPKHYLRYMVLLGLFALLGGCLGNGTLTKVNQTIEETPISNIPVPVHVGYTWKF